MQLRLLLGLLAMLYPRSLFIADSLILMMMEFVAMKVPGIPHSGMFTSPASCPQCVKGKSTVAYICRQCTRDHDPPTCFYMLAVDLWGHVDKAAIGGY